MTTLIITRGLPGSGKTTWARSWVAEAPESRARVNRDDLRQVLFGRDAPLPVALERQLSFAQQGAVRGLLREGSSVVVDDMHLRAEYVKAWGRLALDNGSEFEVMESFLDVSVDECVRRDAERGAAGGRMVGGDVIRDLNLRFRSSGRIGQMPATAPPAPYVPDDSLPGAWIVDIDGTLALMGDRGPFEWHRVGEDLPNLAVLDIVKSLRHSGWKIIVFSGRDSVCRFDTIKWLNRHGVMFDRLLMRAKGDQRRDAIVKRELLNAVTGDVRVVGVLDDRPSVCRMWREIGLAVLQVGDPHIEF